MYFSQRITRQDHLPAEGAEALHKIHSVWCKKLWLVWGSE